MTVGIKAKSFCIIIPSTDVTWCGLSTRSDYAERFGFDPDGQIQNEFFDNNRSLSMEGCCLDRFIEQSNERSFNDNCGGDVHQSNDTIREFHLH